MRYRSVQASRVERTKLLPGDELIQDAIGSTTHAITIRCDRRTLWPWLVQMGAGRAGWYSYGRVDNGRQPSSQRIRRELQGIGMGALFPALPGVTEGYLVAAWEPGRFLVLGWPLPNGTYLATWAFILEELGRGLTRLIVRSRAGPPIASAMSFRRCWASVRRSPSRDRSCCWVTSSCSESSCWVSPSAPSTASRHPPAV